MKLEDLSNEIFNQVINIDYPDNLLQINKSEIADTIKYYTRELLDILNNDIFSNFTLKDKIFYFQKTIEKIYYITIGLIYSGIKQENKSIILASIFSSITRIINQGLIQKFDYQNIITMLDQQIDNLYKNELDKLIKQNVITEIQYINATKISDKEIFHNTDIIKIELGRSLKCLTDINKNINLIDIISLMQSNLSKDYGYVISGIRILNNDCLDNNEVRILIKNKEIARFNVYPEKMLVQQKDLYNMLSDEIKLTSIREIDFITQEECYWVNSSNIQFIDPKIVIMRNLRHVLLKNSDLVLLANDMQKYFKYYSTISIYKNIENLFQKILKYLTIEDIKKILVYFYKREIPISKNDNLVNFYEKIYKYAKKTKDINIIIKNLSNDLSL